MKKNLSNIVLIIVIVAVGIFLYSSYNQRPAEEDAGMKNGDMLMRDTGLEVQTSEVSYHDGVQGYFARPADEESYPGVVMIHEWWGLNDNIKNMAEQLAAEGYAVLAVDLYNGQVAEDAARARELVTSLDQEKATQNLQEGANYLRSQTSEKIASLGWCFGGGQSMQLALSGEELDATVIYYGNLVTDQAELAAINWPVLGIFGEEDSSIPVETVDEFHELLDISEIENEIHIYPGVGHAFANPSGDNYAPEETMDAWEKTLEFLKRSL